MALAIILLFLILGMFILLIGFPCYTLIGASFRATQGVDNMVPLVVTGEEYPWDFPDEARIMYPTIWFRTGSDYWWSIGDAIYPGKYACFLGTISTQSFGNKTIMGQLIPFIGILIWDGETYLNTQQITVVIVLVVVGLLLLDFVRWAGYRNRRNRLRN